ncbi:hypothetical protein MCOR27_011777 [Pyricularia oryzae]|uniref:Zn(2)-C6 fungal-type domain-containing protein n=3 Tax=Pyricularia TaxID=48558 RepID=A0ABQ8N1P6_PYRGI|nr:nitrogen assimilation transcription factor nit-4 [Pyricularia oryzae 70-15]KAH8838915.1 hypothetical protein MCOR01_008160 [Pyricularia oryzae]KAI6289657.1 hypothetical protein MCOR33_011755 [Pyricularia grisea]EHA54684.1 nitrogen assimilation transcription factor nit-4 [Pyricularia oryzae 70-15]KAH9438747.1 hypothetical protein MCOR02_002350 [Pyricularia oryzae]KAI6251595.1 hypothetical protein MCOR19_011764 [Pyricularia oryzae]
MESQMMAATLSSSTSSSKPAPPQSEMGAAGSARENAASASASASVPRKKSRRGTDSANQKRRCVSTACIACRKRKSKCDGANPSCAACASVYGTECVYDPNSDHRRKGVYKEKIDSMKAQGSTLQILIEAILNAAEDDVPNIVKRIRTCDSLDAVADALAKEERAAVAKEEDDFPSRMDDEYTTDGPTEGERDLARKMGELRLENGLVRFIGGTSHLIYTGDPQESHRRPETEGLALDTMDPLTTWTRVTTDTHLIIHLLNMYFNWHYPYFTAMSKKLFYRDLLEGKPRSPPTRTTYCSSLLVNAILALACHFTNVPGAYALPGDSGTKGDHFFAEAKRLIVENGEYEQPRLTTVQALAIMSVIEAGNGREAKGWVYSGMSFRMAQDIGLNLDPGSMAASGLDEEEIDARRVTYWGCFLFDKCWSNYLGRLPQLLRSNCNVPKYDVFPTEDAEMWSPYTDSGYDQSSEQPSRVRAVGLQLVKLSEISSDLLLFFYHPKHIGRSSGKSVELKKLSELHRRLEEWRKELPSEFEPKDGQLPNVILVHMFFHLQYIHLFRPFLRYAPANSPLPAHVSPRRICTANAGAISKLMRLYKKTYNLHQIPNIAVYMLHSACTIHLLNLPEKAARRDIIHGVKHLEEMSEDWLCARRTLSIFSVLARKWHVELPAEASIVLKRTDEKYGTFNTAEVPSPSMYANTTPSAGCGSAGSPLSTTMTNLPQSVAQEPDQNQQQQQQQQYAPAGISRRNSRMDSQTPQESMHASMHPSMLSGYESVPRAVNKQQQQSVASQVPKSVPYATANNTACVSSSVPISMGDAMATMNSWGISPVTQQQTQTIPAYHHQQHPQAPPTQGQSQRPRQYSAMHHNGHNVPGNPSSANRASPTTTNRQVAPQFLGTLDGQEWFLKDSVNWHQNFEAWGLGDSVQTNVGGQGAGGMGGPTGTGTGMPDAASMFMFRGSNGMRDNDGGIDVSVFDSLDTTMNGLDHLSGLE